MKHCRFDWKKCQRFKIVLLRRTQHFVSKSVINTEMSLTKFSLSVDNHTSDGIKAKKFERQIGPRTQAKAITILSVETWPQITFGSKLFSHFIVAMRRHRHADMYEHFLVLSAYCGGASVFAVACFHIEAWIALATQAQSWLCVDSRQPTAINALNNERTLFWIVSQQPASNESTSSYRADVCPLQLSIFVKLFTHFGFLLFARIYFLFCGWEKKMLSFVVLFFIHLKKFSSIFLLFIFAILSCI